MNPNAVVDDLRWKKFLVGSDGFVCLVDVMGDDAAVTQAARVSYGNDLRKLNSSDCDQCGGAGFTEKQGEDIVPCTSCEKEKEKALKDDRNLIRYLMRHRHTTPFEMAEVKLLVRVPMDAWRQWIRHRTANVNEYSTRYQPAIDSMAVTDPDEWRLQATNNKQGSSGILEEWPEGWDCEATPSPSNSLPEHVIYWYSNGRDAEPVIWRFSSEDFPGYQGTLTPGMFLSWWEEKNQSSMQYDYNVRLELGVAREVARKDLPLSTYTEAYWKCDLHNILHFLGLRMDSHAQKEIRDYASIIGERIIAPLFPEVWAAFSDYRLDGMFLTGVDKRAMREVVEFWCGEKPTRSEAAKHFVKITTEGAVLDENGPVKCHGGIPSDWNNERCRERDEFLGKMQALGLIVD